MQPNGLRGQMLGRNKCEASALPYAEPSINGISSQEML